MVERVRESRADELSGLLNYSAASRNGHGKVVPVHRQ